jgi:ssDNA-binding Zn-finger/Zn-ribbon topoisomerase 1
MEEAFVRLRCPECGKTWQNTPTAVPPVRSNFSCPSCHATHRFAEFLRTERELETVKQFQQD